MKPTIISAGVLIYRQHNNQIEFLLAHPGGPFYSKKDLGSWTIPKGLVEQNEDIKKAAQREFFEETGLHLDCPLFPIGSVVLKSGKQIFAFSGEQDLDIAQFKSNFFEMNGEKYPEIDQLGWFSLSASKLKLHPAQHPFLDSVQ